MRLLPSRNFLQQALSRRHAATQAPSSHSVETQVHASSTPHLSPHELTKRARVPPQYFWQWGSEGPFHNPPLETEYIVCYRGQYKHPDDLYHHPALHMPRWAYEAVLGFMYFWVIWHCITDWGEIFVCDTRLVINMMTSLLDICISILAIHIFLQGEFPYLKPKHFTDEELGIPPDDFSG